MVPVAVDVLLAVVVVTVAVLVPFRVVWVKVVVQLYHNAVVCLNEVSPKEVVLKRVLWVNTLGATYNTLYTHRGSSAMRCPP